MRLTNILNNTIISLKINETTLTVSTLYIMLFRLETAIGAEEVLIEPSGPIH